MRGMRRTAITIGVLVMALLPVMAAVSPETDAPPEIPVAITQPIGHASNALSATGSPVLPESGLILLVGSGLLGLASIVRRSTRV